MRHIVPTALFMVLACVAEGRAIVVGNGPLRLLLDHAGFTQGLIDTQSGRQLASGDRTPFASLRRGARSFPVTSLVREGDLVRADFGGADAHAMLRFVPRSFGIEVEVVELDGAADELRFVELKPSITRNVGALLNVSWDPDFAICVMALSDRVNATVDPQHGALTANAVRDLGIAGARAVLIATPTARFLSAVEEVERVFGLPSPKIGGIWVKRSPDLNSGYLFTDLGENNVDEVIKLAKSAGFKAVLTSAWASSNGSYPINAEAFPHGEAGLRDVVDECHRAGLKVGMHTYTSLIDKTDPLVTPRPDPRLLKDAEATLATDLDATATDIPATEPPAGFPRDPARRGGGRDIQIDDEIIAYDGVGGADGRTFTSCRRGFAGTRASAHRAGAGIAHLCERDRFYLADLHTSLKDEIAERVAGVYNRCGFDMIYFDGGELNAADGPAWYWVGQQQMAVYRRLTRDVLVQGSGITHWLWHIFARGTCDDYAVTDTRRYFEAHKVADEWASLARNFMPADLGWLGLVPWAPDHRATRPDEIEYYAARALGLGASLSVESSQAALHANARTAEMLTLLGDYQSLGAANVIPAELRRRLRSGEWRLTRNDGRLVLTPTAYHTVITRVPEKVAVGNEFAAQPLCFRLEAVPVPSGPDDAGNVTLLSGSSPPLRLSPPGDLPAPGELAARLELGTPSSPTADLTDHRALAVELEVLGPPLPAGEPVPVLNVQLESTEGRYRDYDIDLNWRGRSDVVVPEPTSGRLLLELRPAAGTYRFKSAVGGFSYDAVDAVNFRWMRAVRGRPLVCRVIWLKALGEEQDPVVSPILSIGPARFTVPTAIAVGEYLEYWGSGPVTLYDRNGVKLADIAPDGGPLMLQTGANDVTIESRGAARVRFTSVTSGQPWPLASGTRTPEPDPGGPDR